jgi:hypothetical protein
MEETWMMHRVLVTITTLHHHHHHHLAPSLLPCRYGMYQNHKGTFGTATQDPATITEVLMMENWLHILPKASLRGPRWTLDRGEKALVGESVKRSSKELP